MVTIFFKKIVIYFMLFWLICAFSTEIEARILDRIVAVVEDQVILQSDIDLIGMGSDTDVLNHLIEQKLLLKKAEEWEISTKEEQINEYINKIKFENNMNDDSALENYLKMRDMSLGDLRAQIKDEITLLRVKQRIFTRCTPPSDAEVKEYYQTRWEGEKEGEKVLLAHILLNGSEYEKIAHKIITEYKNGVSFDELASIYSQDTMTSSSGGNLGYLEIDNLLPQFKTALETIKPGEITGPIQTSSGYHILKLLEHKPGGLTRESDTWTEIEEKLWEEKRIDYFRHWMEDLKKSSYIKINTL
ncbi:MAG: peptidylprolyl isomerase [bacterium]